MKGLRAGDGRTEIEPTRFQGDAAVASESRRELEAAELEAAHARSQAGKRRRAVPVIGELSVVRHVCHTKLSTNTRPNGARLRPRWAAWAACLTLWIMPCLRAADQFQLSQAQRAVDAYTRAVETTDRDRRIQEFARAEQLFRQVLESDRESAPPRNADLYVNVGNAALQADRLGPAIAAYRRALELDPQNARARQNLAYARSLLPDWARREESLHLMDSLLFWRTMLPRGQILVLGAACFLLAALLLAIGIARRQNPVRNLALLPLLAWLILNLSLWVSEDGAEQLNAVMIAEATVYTADSENSPPRLARPLPSGVELAVVQQRERWAEVRLPDGRTGWVLTATLDRL